jgi:hypothetical protein
MSAIFDFSLNLSEWAKSARELRTNLNAELNAAARRGAEIVAASAKADHLYTDRTERLTRSIRAYAPKGVFTQGTLRTEVVARMRYATFVDGKARFQFLMPAFLRNEGRVEHELHDAVQTAVARAGML